MHDKGRPVKIELADEDVVDMMVTLDSVERRD
jgi:hypothetical protein